MNPSNGKGPSGQGNAATGTKLLTSNVKKEIEPEDSGSKQDSSVENRAVIIRGPSPVRFIPGTTNFLISLKSSGFTAPAILDGLRTLIMIQLGGIVKVSLLYMFQNSLPCIPDIEAIIDLVLKACIAEDLIVAGRWKAFREDPKVRYRRGGIGNNENAIFKDFGVLWNQIIKICKAELPKKPNGKQRQPIVRFRAVPDKAGKGERDSSLTRPDGILELVKSTMIKSLAIKERKARGYCICDVACPVEVKPEDSPEKRMDNIRKLAHTANRYFVDDPRRRAVYGIEIENKDFRVLTYTRTGVIASEHFDWIQDHRSLIKVIMSLSFASEEELGYDPHMRHIEVDVPVATLEELELEQEQESEQEQEQEQETEQETEQEPEQEPETEPEEHSIEPDAPEVALRRSVRILEEKLKEECEENDQKRRKTEPEIAYEIDVDDQTWVTFGSCLSDNRADFFIGRATRIFLVYLKGDPEKTLHVLKISNLTTTGAEVDRLEGNILIDINKRAEELGCSRFFPTLVAHGFPQIEREGMEQKSDSSNLFLRDNVVALGFYPGVTAVRTKTNQSGSSKTAGSNRTHSQGEIYTPTSPAITGLPSNVLTNVKDFLETCFPRRYQYRLVVKEAGTPLRCVTNLADLFYILEQTVYALKWLHIIGYLHRDLSLGNILHKKLYGNDRTPENRGMRVILNDYDSSKKSDVLASEGIVRTGTPEFLSNELIHGLYYIGLNMISKPSNNPAIPPQGNSNSSDPEDSTVDNPEDSTVDNPEDSTVDNPEDSTVDKSEDSTVDIALNSAPHPNYMHDVESLKWIALWFLFNSVPEGYNVIAPNDQKIDQYRYGNAIFSQPHNLLANSQRLTCFIHKGMFENCFKTLPPNFLRFYPHLERLRDHLLGSFLRTELSESFKGPISYKGAKGDASYYEVVAECFRLCQKEVKQPDLQEIEHFAPLIAKSSESAIEKADVKWDPSEVLRKPRKSSTVGTSSGPGY